MSTGKGQKRIKNTPVLYDEIKTKRTIMITPTAWDRLKDAAQAQNISISELIERTARSLDG